MAYSDAQIRNLVAELANKGADATEIETFVRGAKAEQVASLQAPQPQAQQPGPAQAPGNPFFASPPSAETATKIGAMAAEPVGGMVGQAIGMAGGPLAEITMPVMGGLGGAAGNIVGQLAQKEKFSWGKVAAAAIANAIPGAPLAKMGIKGLAGQAAKYAAGNIAAAGAQTGIDEGRLPTLTEAGGAGAAGVVGLGLGKALDSGDAVREIITRKLQGAVTQNTIDAAKSAGYVLDPAKINPSALNRSLQSIAGKAATIQEVGIRNQEITSALARKQINDRLALQGSPPLPIEAPLTKSLIQTARESAYAPYQEISQMAEQAKGDLAALQKSRFTAADAHELAIQMADPDTVKKMSALTISAGADVDALKKARADAALYYHANKVNPHPDTLAKADALSAQAETLEDKIQAAAIQAGRPELAKNLKDARTTIAMTHEIEDALGVGNSDVSAMALGKSGKAGTPFTGELKTISDFQNTFPAMARNGNVIPPSGVSKLKGLLSTGASVASGVGGAAIGHPWEGVAAGAAIGGLGMFSDDAARSLILSKPYQRFMVNTNHGIPQSDALAQFAQRAAQDTGRNAFLDFLTKRYPGQPTQ